MKSIAKYSVLVFIGLLVLAPSCVAAQQLPVTFKYEKEKNAQGSFDYILKPEIPEIQKKFGADNPYQIVGVVARPAVQRAVLVFANAQKEFQLSVQKERDVTITADSDQFDNLEYVPSGKTDNENAIIKLDIANVLISFASLEKISNAKAVKIKFGNVTYQLDKDNLAALRYLSVQIANDR